MIKRFRKWLIEHFLPTWAKESVLKENEQLKAKLDAQALEIERLNAYIDGLENGVRWQRRIVINTGGAKK